MIVRDIGPGLKQQTGPWKREGVGLGNTRSRLRGDYDDSIPADAGQTRQAKEELLGCRVFER